MIGPVRFGALDWFTPVDVSQPTQAFARLPQGFDGFRIALLADLHYGHYVRADFVRRVLDLVGSQRVDMLLLCGDMLSNTRRFAGSLGEMLADLAGRVPCYAVLGNHERFRGTARFRRVLGEAGVELLVNAHRLIRRGLGAEGPAGGPAIALAGLDDPFRGRPDFHAALGGIQPGTFTILAAHRPDLADLAPAELRVDLMLCGHTHGGQVRLLRRAMVTQTRNGGYVSGWTPGPRFPMYISRGLGVVGLPLRIASEPELPIITLRRDSAGQAG